MLQINNLSKCFEDLEVLRDVNLTVKKGEVVVIIGPSGSGKSTFLRCINLLERPSRGAVVIDDQDITKMKDKELRAMRKKIGMIFQHFNLMRSRTVYQNIAFPLKGI